MRLQRCLVPLLQVPLQVPLAGWASVAWADSTSETDCSEHAGSEVTWQEPWKDQDLCDASFLCSAWDSQSQKGQLRPEVHATCLLSFFCPYSLLHCPSLTDSSGLC